MSNSPVISTEVHGTREDQQLIAHISSISNRGVEVVMAVVTAQGGAMKSRQSTIKKRIVAILGKRTYRRLVRRGPAVARTATILILTWLLSTTPDVNADQLVSAAWTVERTQHRMAFDRVSVHFAARGGESTLTIIQAP